MRMAERKIVAVVLLLLLFAGSIVGAGVFAQGAGDNAANVEEGAHKLKVRAEVLQRLLERALTIANVSESLRAEAENLTSINLSSLSADELRSFIDEAKEILSEIRESLNENMILDGSGLAARFLEKIELKLNRTLPKLNLTEQEAEQLRGRIRERLGENLTVRELAKLMGKISKELAHHRALEFYEHAMNFTENAARSGAMHGLEMALNASSKVLDVLERVKERLEKVNASPVAIAAIEHAIEKIASVREVLRQVMERICSKHPGGKATKEQVKEELSSMLEEKLEKLNETIDEYIDELLELRAKAEELNLASLVEEINQSIAELEALKAEILSGNLSFSEVMEVLASAKKFINHAEEVLEKASEEKELAEKISESLREKLREELDEIKEKGGEELSNHIEKAEEELNEAESSISDVEKSTSKKDLTSAEKLLDKAEEALESAEKIIDQLKELLGEETEGPLAPPSAPRHPGRRSLP